MDVKKEVGVEDFMYQEKAGCSLVSIERTDAEYSYNPET